MYIYNPKGVWLSGRKGNQRVYHPRGRSVEFHEGQTSQTLRLVEVCPVIDFKVFEISQGIRKLARTSSDQKKKRKVDVYIWFTWHVD